MNPNYEATDKNDLDKVIVAKFISLIVMADKLRNHIKAC